MGRFLGKFVIGHAIRVWTNVLENGNHIIAQQTEIVHQNV